MMRPSPKTRGTTRRGENARRMLSRTSPISVRAPVWARPSLPATRGPQSTTPLSLGLVTSPPTAPHTCSPLGTALVLLLLVGTMGQCPLLPAPQRVFLV